MQIDAAPLAPIVRRLTIKRFRGIETLDWRPAPGLNVLLGGGDVGKSTVLEAIAILLSPNNGVLLSEADFWQRKVDDGFLIEAVMSLPDSCGINQQTRCAWPWAWDGTDPKLPTMNDGIDGSGDAIPVYRLQVRGTPEFDLVHEILQPDGSSDHLSAAVRRRIGLVKLGGDDRNDRDLRLVQGSALDRLITDRTLKARIGQSVGECDIDAQLLPEAKERLEKLDRKFRRQALPSGLRLGITGSQGMSLNALVGLLANKASVKLPLGSWGAGTRRLSALEIAGFLHSDNPVTIVDEAERGLEPYRQRSLIATLQAGESQVFLTTHSTAVLSAASKAYLWYIDGTGTIGRIPDNLAAHQRRDPETFLARLAIIAEGPTEVGFVSGLIEREVSPNFLSLGLWISDGGGNDHTLKILEGLNGSGLRFAGFADDEGRDQGRWASLKGAMGDLLFRWPAGCVEENVIALIPEAALPQLVAGPTEDVTEARYLTLSTRLGKRVRTFDELKVEAPDARALIVAAAIGSIPTEMRDSDRGKRNAYKAHGQKWFKSIEGGNELAEKVFRLGIWPKLQPQLRPFLDAVRHTVGIKLSEARSV